MPTPTIPDGELFMNATTYTGNGAASRAITNGAPGQSFQPDMVWIKRRSTSDNHTLYDSVRVVATVPQRLFPNLTSAEDGNFGSLDSFNTNGFTVGANVATNENAQTYVAWQWKAGGAAVTNTAGSISAQVSANTTSGFSVVTYTGTGSNATVGHGLGVAPAWVIVKGRNVGSTNWFIYTAMQGATKYLDFSTGTGGTDSSSWNNTAPTSSVFSVGSSYYTNYAATTYVAYCWTPIAGYSAFGSYTGNGSTDGTFVYLGFRPKFILIKNSNVAGNNWWLLDAARSTYNVQDAKLNADTSDAENNTTAVSIDFLSNGFKPRTTNGGMNGSGNTMIYMAFAENPFKYANAR